MKEVAIIQTVRVAVALLVGVVLPAVGIAASKRMLAGRVRTVVNHRGVEVPVDLWVVWVFWAVGASLVLAVADIAYAFESASQVEGVGLAYVSLAVAPLRSMWPALVLGTLVAGLVDDLFGDREFRGFAGHLGALAKGRLTTGMLKLVGVGAFSAGAVGVVARDLAPWAVETEGWARAGAFLAATATVALCANLANLLDVRPGRLAKVATASAFTLGLVVALTGSGVWAVWSAVGDSPVAGRIMSGVSLFLLVAGPLLVVWEADHKERGMLGDAGSNPAGALVGLALVGTVGVVGLVAALVVVAALNLLSEKVSFSALIEDAPLLRALDSLGRVEPSRAGETDESATQPAGRFDGSGATAGQSSVCSDETPEKSDER
ncbi:MAG: hypothetical protein Kow0056_00740 [Coriobacteriia bacterium]